MIQKGKNRDRVRDREGKRERMREWGETQAMA